MPLVEIIKKGFKCERCEHEWIPNDMKKKPKVCPLCKSPYWDTPRRNGKNTKRG